MTTDRNCIPVDTIVAALSTMAVACMLSIHVFTIEFNVMHIEAMLLPYKLLYPQGYKFS
jgi:hypothetical protein